MEIIPAIDLRNGKCVRLHQGDYNQETIFDNEPVAVALRWYSQGAQWLHVVDLDGAAAGKLVNMEVVEEIIKESGLSIELGGGIRREEIAEDLLHKGIRRIILGTAAIENPALVKKLCQQYGEAIVVGIDARDGNIAIHGWQKDTFINALEFSLTMLDAGVKRFIYTDITRDGTLSEPNFEMISKFLTEVKVPIIAAGGISKLEHLQRLKQLGVEGAIIGKALYTGNINLQEAIIQIS